MKHIKLFEAYNATIKNKKSEPAGLPLGDAVRSIEELEVNGLYWLPVPTGGGFDYPVLGCLNGIEGDTFVFDNTPDDFPQEVHDAANADPDYHDEDNLYQGMAGDMSRSEMETEIKHGKVFKYKKQ